MGLAVSILRRIRRRCGWKYEQDEEEEEDSVALGRSTAPRQQRLARTGLLGCSAGLAGKPTAREPTRTDPRRLARPDLASSLLSLFRSRLATLARLARLLNSSCSSLHACYSPDSPSFFPRLSLLSLLPSPRQWPTRPPPRLRRLPFSPLRLSPALSQPRLQPLRLPTSRSRPSADRAREDGSWFSRAGASRRMGSRTSTRRLRRNRKRRVEREACESS